MRPVAGLVLVALACVSGGQSALPSAEVTREVGVASATDFGRGVQAVLRRHGYDIIRSDGPPTLYVETDWHMRQPFVDEADRGVTHARTRILVRGRARGDIGTADVLYTVHMTVESWARIIGQEDWTRMPASPRLTEFAQSLSQELAMEMDVGARKYTSPAPSRVP
jgi:hypothetical protein